MCSAFVPVLATALILFQQTKLLYMCDALASAPFGAQLLVTGSVQLRAGQVAGIRPACCC